MTVAIVNFTDDKYQQLCEAMEKLISDSQCFLFDVAVGSKESIAYKWAQDNGAPVKFIENSMDAIIKEANYLMVWNDNSVPIHRLIFKFKSLGRHGTLLGEKFN